MSIKTVFKTSLVTSLVVLSMVQLQSIVINQARGAAPLTAPLTSFVTITPTPTEVPLTAPEQSTPTPTVAPTTAPNNNSGGGSNNGGSSNNNGGNSNSGSNGGGNNVCRNERPKSAPVIISVRPTGASQVTLTWKKGWGPVNEYVIWYGTTKEAAMFTTAVIKGEEQLKTATIDGLKPRTVYYFKVQPRNGCTPGSFSNIFTSYGRLVSNGYAQGVNYSVKPGIVKTSTAPAKTFVQPSAPKQQTAINSISGFFKSIFK